MEDYRLQQDGQGVQDILNGAAMQTGLTAEVERAEGAEGTLQNNIDAEERARQQADGVLQDHIDAEETRAKAAEKQNADDIDAIEEKIPSGASSANKLATQGYVDDSVATATATFRGTFNLVSDLHLTLSATEGQIATALAGAILTADNNDYCFVQIPTSAETPTQIARIDRSKYNGTAWAFEYSLNNSGFTSAQWDAINSGITSGLVAKLGDLPTAAALATALAGKQDVLTFDNAPTESSQNPVKSGGIYTAIANEAGLRADADTLLQSAIEGILALIPSAATALNQLADKAFVNSSVATATATFRGTWNLVSDLNLEIDATHADIAAALLTAISTADNNDYAFVQIPTSADTPTEIRVTERYKFNGTAWAYEYDLNNSGFTAAQWAAINSGITIALVQKLGALPTASELATALAGKQNTLTFDYAPAQGSQNPVYSGGLYTLFAAIDAKMPSAASASNKLVDENRLAAYVATIIGALDASYNVTSTDGHVSVNITQADGAITALQVLTNDIASATALTALGTRVSQNEVDIAALQALYKSLQQSAPQVIRHSDTWPVDNPSQTVIYRVIDRENTPPTYYCDYMWDGNGTTLADFILMAKYNNAIDAVPTAGSTNLVESGGIVEMYGGYEQDAEFVQRIEDADEKIIAGIKQDGKVFIPELQSPSMESFVNKRIQEVREEVRNTFSQSYDKENRVAMTLDKDGKVVSYRKSDGTLYEPRIQVDELFLGEKAKKTIKNVSSVETIITVDKNGDGDYTSLLEAVMASQGIGKCTIVVNSGEYDLIAEYKAVFGNDYFDNYAANYNGYANGRIDAGLFLWPNVSLEGNGFVRIKFDYTGSNANVRTYFAPLNTTNNVTVEDITITTNEDMCCRYLIHDDFAQGAGVNIFRNIIFEGNSNGGSIIGAGMGTANTYIVENCYFTNEATFDDINYHNVNTELTDVENLLMVRNCKGGGKCVVQTIGNSDKKTKCIVSNSEFTQIVKRRSSADTYNKDNMELIKFLNNETNV